MSNNDGAGSQAGVWLCRVGERVYVAAGGGEPRLHEALSSRALREMRFGGDDAEFSLLQIPVGFDHASLPGESVAVGLDRFLEEAVASGLRGAFLKRLYGISGLFQLETDPLFQASTRALREAAERRAAIRMDVVEGMRTAIAVIPSRAKIASGDLLIAIDGSVTVGSFEHISPILMRDAPRQKLAAVRFPATPVAQAYILVSDNGVIAVDAQIDRHESTDAFHATRTSGDADIVALMALADGDAGPSLDRLTRRTSGPLPVRDDFYDLYFELTASVALENGLLLAGWFHDPDGLIESVTAIDPGLEKAAAEAHWATFGGVGNYGNGERPIKRFAAFLPRCRGTRVPLCAPPVRIALSNGESHLAFAETGKQDLVGKRTRILETITRNTFVGEQVTAIYGSALAPLQAAINDRQAVRENRSFGVRSRRKVSLIIPLYRETGFIRAQLMAFSADPFVRENCEIVFVLDDPLITGQVMGLLEGSTFVYPLDLTLVLLAVNGGYALANNFGAGAAAGEALVLMNSDVIPKTSGWLQPALDRLASLPAFSVIGPKLIYADETLQHAGMYFYRLSNGYWQNFHYWKGYGGGFVPADRERIVPAVTGACMVLRKHDFEAVGGFTSDYVVGDYEDSDLCLKLRGQGGVPLYMPSIELYHFERQSMPTDEDAVDRGSTVYNRAIHTMRWGDAIAALMAEEKDVRHAG